MGVAIMEMEKVRIGRPSVITDAVVAKLEHCAAHGLSVIESAVVVGVSRHAIYRFFKTQPAFRNRLEQLRQMPSLHAKLRIVKAIQNGDVKAAQWWLERKCPEEFGRATKIKASARNKAVTDLSPEEIQEELERLVKKTSPRHKHRRSSRPS